MFCFIYLFFSDSDKGKDLWREDCVAQQQLLTLHEDDPIWNQNDQGEISGQQQQLLLVQTPILFWTLLSDLWGYRLACQQK